VKIPDRWRVVPEPLQSGMVIAIVEHVGVLETTSNAVPAG